MCAFPGKRGCPVNYEHRQFVLVQPLVDSSHPFQIGGEGVAVDGLVLEHAPEAEDGGEEGVLVEAVVAHDSRQHSVEFVRVSYLLLNLDVESVLLERGVGHVSQHCRLAHLYPRRGL